MKRLVVSLLLGAMATGAAPAALAQAKPPVVQPAVDGIFAAFKSHPIVGMSDAHGLAQQQDFYAAIIRDPRFTREVGHVVVEFGTASHQEVIDRYVAGEDVPYAELRKVWADAVGWNPTVTYIGFANVFATVRAVNATLPADQRIRVWLGDPPIDWAKANGAEVRVAMEARDTHAAGVVVDNILSKNRKALVIYGGAHLISDVVAGAKPRAAPSAGAEEALKKFLANATKGTVDYTTLTPHFAERVRPGAAGVQRDLNRRGEVTAVAFKAGYDDGRDYFKVTFANTGATVIVLTRDAQGLVTGFGIENPNLRDQVEERYPDSVFMVWPHRGDGQGRCAGDFEQALKDWPAPALATSVDRSSLEAALKEPGCSVVTARSAWLDGFLYLGPVATLQRSPALPDLYLDSAFRAEISRRQPLKGAQPLPAAIDMTQYPATARRWP